MRFRYLRDPLFLACLAAYFINHFVLKRIWSGGFVHSHFNDLICIPFWVPIMLWLEKLAGLRQIDTRPELHEIIIPVVIWSWIFEIILPQTELFREWCVGDELDVICYALGGLGAMSIWRWIYRAESVVSANSLEGGQSCPPSRSTHRIVRPPPAAFRKNQRSSGQ